MIYQLLSNLILPATFNSPQQVTEQSDGFQGLGRGLLRGGRRVIVTLLTAFSIPATSLSLFPCTLSSLPPLAPRGPFAFQETSDVPSKFPPRASIFTVSFARSAAVPTDLLPRDCPDLSVQNYNPTLTIPSSLCLHCFFT